MTTMEATPSAAAAPNPAAPHIVTELPGPKARAIIARDEAVASPSLTRAYPLVAESGLGHRRHRCRRQPVPRLRGRHRRLLDRPLASEGRRGHQGAGGSAHPHRRDRLLRAALPRVHGATCGHRAVQREGARLPHQLGHRGGRGRHQARALPHASARDHRLRGGVPRSNLGALSLTNSKIKQRAGFGPLLPMVHHAPFPRVRAWREGSGGDGICRARATCGARSSAARSRRATSRPSSSSRSRARAATSRRPAPFLRGLRDLCDEHGILLIADEIQSGMGRTGRWWAIEHAGVEPDIVTTAKGIASGMPIGAFIARDSVWTWPPGAHGSTFAGNPVCAAGGTGDARDHRDRGARQRGRHGRSPSRRARARGRRTSARSATSAARASCSASSSTPTRRPRRSRRRRSGRPPDPRVRRVVAALQPTARGIVDADLRRGVDTAGSGIVRRLRPLGACTDASARTRTARAERRRRSTAPVDGSVRRSERLVRVSRGRGAPGR